ncbi:beta-1,3-galactosyltransferase 1 [Gadus morhua]|uniref:beta-1,3-galactosyltransferase 1 n=1 Tax=Gadus morhua TaxID=8049 RepID=UPI0011B41DF1|nr:beta-1,3-galactosyltransferase 1-like [Gadus morhua]
MTVSFRWRLVKFLTASTALFLLVQLLLSGFAALTLDEPRRQSPLPTGTSRLLSPSTYSYVLNQPDLCRDQRPLLLALVPVAPGDRTSRDVVRRTWGAKQQEGSARDPLLLTVFYVGVSSEPGVQGALVAESGDHGDIIQMDFVDSYQNLTIKTLMIMNWVATFCPNASHAMKVDADIFVNVYLLVEVLRGYPTKGFITGSVIRDGRPRRDPKSRWYVSEEAYPDSYFPPYVSGAGYVFSTDVARKVSLASRSVPMVPLEDVYVGLCLRAAGVSPVYAQSFLALRNLFEVRHLAYDRCAFAARVIVNGFKPAELLSIWEDFSVNRLTC